MRPAKGREALAMIGLHEPGLRSRRCETAEIVAAGRIRQFTLAATGVQALFGLRIRPEHFDKAALLLEQPDRPGDLAVELVAVAIDEKEIFPGLAFAGARLDFCEVNAAETEGGE